MGRKSVFDIYFTEFGAALRTVLLGYIYLANRLFLDYSYIYLINRLFLGYIYKRN